MTSRMNCWSIIWVPLLLCVVPGCYTKPAENKSSTQERATEDPWPSVTAAFRRNSDLATARRTLELLRISLSSQKQSNYLPEPLSAQDEARLKSLLKLSDTEVRELRDSLYSSFDANYLAETLYLRDIVATIDVQGRPLETQAQAAFEWVCRQIVLEPWIVNRGGQQTFMPPVDLASILQRGSGSGLERAYVFLALLNQMKLPGVLIGPAEAERRNWSYRVDPTNNQSVPTGPFWAVGTLIDQNLVLFDPWRGERFPGTWSELKANPALLNPWREDAENSFTISVDDIRSPRLYLTPSLSALAPRWKRFEEQFRTETPPIVLYFDLEATQRSYAEATQSGPPSVWLAEGDLFTPTRILLHTTPKTEGGLAATSEFRDLYRFSLIPQNLFSIPSIIRGRAPTGPNDPGERGIPELNDLLRNRCFESYAQLFLSPPTTRELFQRGQFSETIPTLIKKRDNLAAGLERMRTDRNRSDDASVWTTKLRDAYNQLLRAKDKESTDPQAVLAAERKVKDLIQQYLPRIEALFDSSFIEVGNAEATYLLALAMHERAEQKYRQYERFAADPRLANSVPRVKEEAIQEWQEALGWWSRYLPLADEQEPYFKGRTKHAQKLSERAERTLSQLLSN